MSVRNLHPRGLFGVLDGIEVEFSGTGRAHPPATLVDYAVARRADVPPSTQEAAGSRPSDADIILVPRSSIEGLARWKWTVTFEGAPYDVVMEQDGRFLISTPSTRVADRSEEWEGSFHDGWVRWIDPTGLTVTAERHPLDVGGE